MDKHEIERRKREIEGRYGPWTAHNLELGAGIYTIRPGVAGGNEFRLRRVVQLISDLVGDPIDRLRVLDLGALEGLFSVELARRGAAVVAVEGREASLEKIRFAKQVLELDGLDVRHQDVRTIDADPGEFDVVLCLGLLYHLDAPDVFVLLERMRELCRNLVLIETRLAPHAIERRDHRGRSYWGTLVPEPPPDAPALSRDVLWSSIGNRNSFELTRPSLCNALADAGYSSVLECHFPPAERERASKPTFAAFAHDREEILSVPGLDAFPWERQEEARLQRIQALRRVGAFRWLAARVRWVRRRLTGRR